MERASIYDNVVPEVFVPALIRATSQSVFDEDLEVLVHVNHQPGVHALTYVQDGVQHLVAFIPPEDFILGANHIAFVGRLNGAATLLYENH